MKSDPSIPVSGNVNDVSKDTRGWFLGHFMPGEENPLRTGELELKWYTPSQFAGPQRPNNKVAFCEGAVPAKIKRFTIGLDRRLAFLSIDVRKQWLQEILDTGWRN